MARESVHAKLERVRPPRVHVTYNVEIGNAIELKEIPLFVMEYIFWPTSVACPKIHSLQCWRAICRDHAGQFRRCAG